jgi:glucose/arabinose dehydrogenase
MGLTVLVLAPAAYAQAPAYEVRDAFPALEFRRPVDLQPARDGSGRLYVVEQDGVIRVFEDRPDVARADVFLDIKDRVDTGGNEMGLLGLAFSPDYASSGHFFVDYTASDGANRTRVSRFAAKGPGADPKSERVVIEIAQPWSNHNGGQVAFGPDGMLYIAMGDGGSAGDPRGHAQNRASLLGKILRIDVSALPYRIPADNPFANNRNGWSQEIFAYGLRNPWRFSFDPETGALWTGDVGQNAFEEIDVIQSGGNYGWNCREGFEPYGRSCSGDFVAPVWAYGRNQGVSVTGGYVYRGEALPDLVGWYVYADYGSGRIWALQVRDGEAENRLLVDSDLFISSFGCDANGEILICSHNPGNSPTRIYRLVTK